MSYLDNIAFYVIEATDESYIIQYEIPNTRYKGYICLDVLDEDFSEANIQSYLHQKYAQQAKLLTLTSKPDFNDLSLVTRYLVHKVFDSTENMYFVDAWSDDKDEINFVQENIMDLFRDIEVFKLHDCIEIDFNDFTVKEVTVYPDLYTRFNIPNWSSAMIDIEPVNDLVL